MHRSQFSGLKLKIALEGNTLSIDSAVQEVAASPTAKAATLRSQLHDTDHTEPGLNSSYFANVCQRRQRNMYVSAGAFQGDYGRSQ